MAAIQHDKQPKPVSAFAAFWKGLLALELFFLSIIVILLTLGTVIGLAYLGFNLKDWQYGPEDFRPSQLETSFAGVWIALLLASGYAVIVTPFVYPLVAVPIGFLIDRHVPPDSWRASPLSWAGVGAIIMLLPPIATLELDPRTWNVFGISSTFVAMLGGGLGGFAMSRQYFGMSVRSAMKIPRQQRDTRAA